MKIKKSNNRRKYIILAILLAIVLLASAFAAYTLMSSNNSKRPVNKNDRKNTVTTDSGQTPNSQKAEIPVKQDTGSNTNSDDPNQQSAQSGASIKLISYKQQDGNVTLVMEMSATKTNGTCIFSFSSDGAKPIVRSVMAKDKTCTLAVPEVEFEKIGVWQVKTNYSKDNVTLAESTDAITVN